MNSVYKDLDKDIPKSEMEALMVKRASYRGIYKLYDTVNYLFSNLNNKIKNQEK